MITDGKGRKEKRKKGNAKTSIDRVVGKANTAALWKTVFL